MVDHVLQDLYVRTTYQNAGIARRQIRKGKAVGRHYTVRFRAWTQTCLERLGQTIHRKTHVFFIPLLLGLFIMMAGFKAIDTSSLIDQLWIESGGRLEAEMHYSASALGESESVTNLLFTQTARAGTSPEMPQQRLLHRKALLAHLSLLKIATHVTVSLYDVSWSLKDLCLSPSPPTFDVPYIDNIFDGMMPCEIITPLDCFWEGSKLLGPESPIVVPGVGNSIKWTNLNPQSLMKSIRASGENSNFPFDILENYMKRGGINSGYQDKPCLDPDDPECPDTAPNKKSKKIPDIGAELSNGCRGFASKFMHWPKELILGGIIVNKTGYIKNAGAIQSIIQLLGEKELYEYWSNSYKVLHISWDQEKAALVIKMWQKKLFEEIRKHFNANPNMQPYNIYTFSTKLLKELLSQYDYFNAKLVTFGCLILVLYVCFIQVDFFDAVRSQLFVSLCSVLLMLLSIVSGIGFCCLIGIQIHSATLGVLLTILSNAGVHNVSLFMCSYKRVSSHGFNETTRSYDDTLGKKQVGMVLKSAGTSVIMTCLILISVFMTAAIVPIPALRALCLQVAVVNVFILVSTIFGITCLVSFDVRRKRSKRIDLFCCIPSEIREWPWSKKHQYAETANTNDGQAHQFNRGTEFPLPKPSNVLPKEFVDTSSDSEDIPTMSSSKTSCCDWTSRGFTQKYMDYLTTITGRVHVILLFLFVLSVSIWGITRLQAGLTLPEMVPNAINEQKFIGTYGELFGFYNIYAVTRDNFEYPSNQKLLHEYHDAFMRVPNILKNDNGGLPQMWLTLFREWLLGLQKAFDKDWAKKCITIETWDKSCASENGILGYKLLVQTGNNDNPIDKSLASTARLVDENGIINVDTFYNLLTAWVSNDILAYGASQANIRPEPRRWLHIASDYDLQIVKSSPIIYAQMPFYATYLHETPVITKFISTVRAICNHFDERGLPNYPSGIPFLYWEQYQELNQYFYVTIVSALAFLFLICVLFLCNIRAALITLFMSIVLVIQIMGFMGFTEIKFSAIPAVLLIGTIGTGSVFSIYHCLSFVTSIGDNHRRTHLCVEHMSKMVFQSGITLIISAIMLFFQDSYVSRSYLLILLAETVCGLFNGLVCLPVFLSMFGPSPEIIPLKYPDRICTPSPEPIKKCTRYSSVRQSIPFPPSSRLRHHQRQNHRRHHQQQLGNNSNFPQPYEIYYQPPRERDGSLSTIAEESGSYHSGSTVHIETTNSQPSLSRSPSMSSQYNGYSTDSGSEIDAPSQQTQSVPLVQTQTAPHRCILTAKFELDFDPNVMNAAAVAAAAAAAAAVAPVPAPAPAPPPPPVQPYVHTSSSKPHHNNHQPPKRHVKRHHLNPRY